jgi:3-hydroxyisobutyrate dehydrogenase-like beta-hydroxyacid dehydrogenase
MDQKGEKMIRADYRPEARIRQHHKDVRLMLEQGQRFGAPMFLTSVMDQILQTAEAGGLSDMDNSTVIEVLRRFAGIPAAEDATPSRGGTHD